MFDTVVQCFFPCMAPRVHVNPTNPLDQHGFLPLKRQLARARWRRAMQWAVCQRLRRASPPTLDRRLWGLIITIRQMQNEIDDTNKRLALTEMELEASSQELVCHQKLLLQMEDEGLTTCVVCMTRQRSTIFKCGHAVCCVECAQDNRMTNCPICRRRFPKEKKFTPMYLS